MSSSEPKWLVCHWIIGSAEFQTFKVGVAVFSVLQAQPFVRNKRQNTRQKKDLKKVTRIKVLKVQVKQHVSSVTN